MSPEELELDVNPNPTAADDSAESMAEFDVGGDYDVLDDDAVEDEDAEDEDGDDEDGDDVHGLRGDRREHREVELGSNRDPVERDADDDSPQSLDDFDDDDEDDEDDDDLEEYFGGDKDNY